MIAAWERYGATEKLSLPDEEVNSPTLENVAKEQIEAKKEQEWKDFDFLL